MSSKINTPVVMSLFTAITFLFFLNSCDTLNSSEKDEKTQFSFDYNVYNEHGELLSAVSDKQINDDPIKASAGYFGSEFFPPWLLENISENSPINPEDLKEKKIYLHAETELPETSKTYSLRLSFPEMQQWETGEYHLPSISKEKHLELLRFMWETRQNSPFSRKSLQSQFPKSNETDVSQKLASVDYSESGFMTANRYGVKIDSTDLLYRPTKGAVELTHISDDAVKGDFTVELLGFPMKILFFSDEFPENPELQMFIITGNFTAIPGDYYDLVDSSENILH